VKAQRQVWGETLAELAGTDQRLVVLDADLATSTRADIVADAHPGSFIQVGIAEQAGSAHPTNPLHLPSTPSTQPNGRTSPVQAS